MNLYLDTSALVKLYVHEAESSAVRRHVRAAARTATSRLAYPEARAALARRSREGVLSARGALRAAGQLDAEWNVLLVVDLDDQLTRQAGDVAERYALRGADAVHRASALRFAGVLAAPVSFLAYDARLAAAAARAGLAAL